MTKTASAPETSSVPGTTAYQLRVELDRSKPKVWRRLLVPTTVELPQLHVALLLSMGWDGGELHEFVFGHDNYGPSEPGLVPCVTARASLIARLPYDQILTSFNLHKVNITDLVASIFRGPVHVT